MSASVLFFDVFLTLLLVGVGVLMAVLYLRVRALTQADRQLPALSDQFVAAMEKARLALRDMGSLAQTRGAELDDKIFIAERALQDLTYVLDRAEKILARLDAHTGIAQPPVQAPVQPTPQPRLAPETATRVDAFERPRPNVEPRGMPPVTEAAQRRRKTDTPAADAVVMPGRQAAIARRLAAQAESAEPAPTAAAPAFKPATRQGSAAVYAAMSAAASAADRADTAAVTRAPLSDVERDLRRALEETL